MPLNIVLLMPQIWSRLKPYETKALLPPSRKNLGQLAGWPGACGTQEEKRNFLGKGWGSRNRNGRRTCKQELGGGRRDLFLKHLLRQCLETTMRGKKSNLKQKSGTKIQPKEEVFGRTSLRTSRQKLRSGPPNPGKTSISERTSRADVHEKNFGLKNSGLIFRSLKKPREFNFHAC